jgi:7-keto-8-aminopelargonate synthetase-like enzyme
MTEPEPLQQVNRTYVLWRRRKLSYFSGCDYYRLASHPKVVAALKAGLEKYGLNVAASRLTSGNHVLYVELEKRTAEFFGAPQALLTANGYLANLIVAQALAGRFSHVLLDGRAHASLQDAAGLMDCPVLRFKHRDVNDFAEAVERCGAEARLIALTDGMFSHDGSVAPLKEYLTVLPEDALLLVDDAHGAGVLGQTGLGSLEATGVGRRHIIQTITLSKAFGVYGGAILGARKLRQQILERSRLFVGSTPLPLPLVNAALQSLAVLKADSGLRKQLHHNVSYVRTALRKAGLEAPENPGPIVTMPAGSSSRTAQLNRALLAADIYPPFVRYPGSPANGYFRFAISSEHTRSQLDRLVQVLASQETCRDLREQI